MSQSGQRGISLVALMVAITLMLISLAIMLPSWEYVMKNEKEEELIFRGYQIADAIQRCQQTPGKGPANSIEDLVKKHCLRKPFKDPMTKDGKWVIVPPMAGQQYMGGGAVPAPTPLPAGMSYAGPMGGVVSRSTEKGLRRLNGKEKYNEWVFLPRPAVAAPAVPGTVQAGQPQREWVFLGGRARRYPVSQVSGIGVPGAVGSPTPRY